jgi:hypothetical protein
MSTKGIKEEDQPRQLESNRISVILIAPAIVRLGKYIYAAHARLYKKENKPYDYLVYYLRDLLTNSFICQKFVDEIHVCEHG